MTEILMIPLARLYIHPLNSRSEPPPAEIELLANSIRDTGLLQNLMGYRDADHDPAYADPNDLQSWTCGIVAGGRRLRALQLLHGPVRGNIDIPVLVTADAATAAEWAGTENTARAALNPADEVRAYQRMRMQGATYARIACAFAVNEHKVMGRLKLATLSDPVLDALRAQQISIDQAQALTVAVSAAAAEALLPTVISSNGSTYNSWSADRIRRELRASAVPLNDRRARLVGIDTYADRGGRIQPDIFSEDMLQDAALLDVLFAEALEAERQKVLAEGWAQVHAFDAAYPDYEHIRDRGDTELQRIPVDLPEADADELDDLERRAETNELTKAEMARRDELVTRAEGDYDDAQRAAATAYIYVNNPGEVVFVGAWLPKANADPDAASTGGTIEAKAETIPQNLRDDINIIRTLGLQTALLDKPELVLDLLHLTLTLTADIWAWHRPLSLTPTAQNLTPSKPDETTVHARLAEAMPAGGNRTINDLVIGMLDLARADGKKARNAAITAALARCFHMAASEFGLALAARLRVDYRQVWHPTADNYFKRLPGGMLDRIWDDLVPDREEVTKAFRALKKADKAKDLHQLFHSADFREALGLSRDQNARIDHWLPPELDLPEVTATALEDAA